MTVKALVFDFDGLIVDTESPEFETVREVYEAHGAPLTLTAWQHRIGTATRHWLDELEDLVGALEDREAVRLRRLERHHALVHQQELLPGVERLVEEAVATGVSLGIASSSTDEWVCGHLERLGLLRHFSYVSCRREGVPPKPAPDVYLAACRALGVAPHEAVALEDSPHGVCAAKAAGLWCVAVPGPLTADLDFAGADLVVESLADLTLDRLAAVASSE